MAWPAALQLKPAEQVGQVEEAVSRLIRPSEDLPIQSEEEAVHCQGLQISDYIRRTLRENPTLDACGVEKVFREARAKFSQETTVVPFRP